jgi:triosephosphate isomerase
LRMKRKFFVAGNWKMNGSTSFNEDLINFFNQAEIRDQNVEIGVAVPSVYLSNIVNNLRKDWFVAAQNCFKNEKGAYTGEISCHMLKDIGVNWSIIGHSERRIIFNESDELVGEKCEYLLSQGMKVILCVGELRSERESGETKQVCLRQLKAATEKLKDWSNLVIAYEPVWAIGTGKVATPEEAQEVHKVIREWLRTSVSATVAESMSIVYGGSVKAENCVDLGKRISFFKRISQEQYYSR